MTERAATGLPLKDLFRVREVASYFSVNVRTVYRWIELSILDTKKIGGTRYVTRDSIQSVLSA